MDKNLSQQTKNWDRFIDPPYSRAQHNFTCMTHSAHTAYIRRDRGREQEYTEHSTAHTEQHTQHVAFLCPNIFVLVNIQWRSVYKHTYLYTHTQSNTWNYVLDYINMLMLLYEWTLRICEMPILYRTLNSSEFLFSVFARTQLHAYMKMPKPESKEHLRLWCFVTVSSKPIF